MHRKLFKVCMIGDFAVGKTSLVQRFMYNEFRMDYQATIGVNISKKEVIHPSLPAGRITLIIWDLAGGEPFTPVVEAYYRGAMGALFVADVTRPSTVEHLATYIRDFRSVSPHAQGLILLNKIDLLSSSPTSVDELKAVAESFGMPVYLTSARTGQNVEEAFTALGHRLVEQGAYE
ncbi:MAG: GTP-binding protein [Chloroflexi bacterium]|nr:GTP-binding protein [Chloroflexota bacterium]